jgi:hypothetical protein
MKRILILVLTIAGNISLDIAQALFVQADKLRVLGSSVRHQRRGFYPSHHHHRRYKSVTLKEGS